MEGWSDELGEIQVGGQTLLVAGPAAAPQVVTLAITCGRHEAFPPGVPRTSSAVCECEPGRTRVGRSCEFCQEGTYKPGVGDRACTFCSLGRSTRSEGATEEAACMCPPGQVMEAGVCELCPPGYWCDGGGKSRCAEQSTTLGGGKTGKAECLCVAGYTRSTSSGLCQPCEPARYKTMVGDEACAE